MRSGRPLILSLYNRSLLAYTFMTSFYDPITREVMKLSTKKVIITRGDFTAETTEYLWSLYQKSYADSKESFLERMKKNNLFALYLADGFLVGFTGLRINRATINGKKRFFICFGQTVIDKAHRGKSLIPLTGAKLCKMFFKDLLRSKAYFWAECLSYKAYLIFRKSLTDCYPSFREPISEEIKAVRDYIGKTHYPDTYCPRTGTVMEPIHWMKDSCVTIGPTDLQDEDIRFFVQANPHYKQGHGLIALAPISFRNIGRLLWRFLNRSIAWQSHRQGLTQTDRPTVLYARSNPLTSLR